MFKTKESNELELFPTIKEVIKELFPDASSADVKKYTKQVSNADEYDPLLVIKPNEAWIAAHGWAAYNAVMDQIATYNLTRGRRDENSRRIFHFRGVQELYFVRDTMFANGIIPNAFHVPSTLRPFAAPGANNLIPIGRVYIVHKLGSKKSEYGEDTRFFHVN